jgi:hypothetical protein
LTGCRDTIAPATRTFYLNKGDRKAQRQDAIPRLYEYYINSERDRQAYEVFAKKNGKFILNYVPSIGLLTLCGEPGFGWSKQFIDVDSTLFRKLVDRGA